MTIFSAPVKDLQFVIHEMLELDKYQHVKTIGQLDIDLIDAILIEAAKFSEQETHPLNRVGDIQGVSFDDGVVKTPAGFVEAYKMYANGGWQGLTGDPEYGGQGLPQFLSFATSEVVIGPNPSFSMYTGLTKGAVEAIYAFGTEAQKSYYLPKLNSGEWTAAMNLTEPHAGTDLGLLTTRAEPDAQGGYKITGTKTFISSGDHDLSENIIHLVLARVPDSPEGSRGISLFLVPKRLANKDGELSKKNAVSCQGIEHKMGLRGSATCTMSFEGAVGYLIGEQNQGLKAMFKMMNATRLFVGVQSLGISEVAYQNAVAYAKERLQGKAHIDTPRKEQSRKADPIISHPDVRRMLMIMRSFNEGMRALILWSGLKLDVSLHSPNVQERQNANALVGFLTPIVKAHASDTAEITVSMALQCFGGYGYIQETGIEQMARDVRIGQIYEGANGVQAMDLLGRKVLRGDGESLAIFLDEIENAIAEAREYADLNAFSDALAQAALMLKNVTKSVSPHCQQSPNYMGAISTDYLHLSALTAMAFMWTKMVTIAHLKLTAGEGDQQFYKNKIKTGRFYIEYMLPKISTIMSRIKSGSEHIMAIQSEEF